MARVRLDKLLVERGLFDTRAQAGAAVLAGEVRVGSAGVAASKPGQQVEPDSRLSTAARKRYVSRGGQKLECALGEFGIDVTGVRCLDVGSSTGGFTDCLLKHGAGHVVAVDVAYGILHWSLRTDPRVTVVERVNARNLSEADLPYRPDLMTVDVSFISLSKVLPAVLALAAESFRCLALVKPQFEAGREHVQKGGVVRDAAARRRALVAVGAAVQGLGYTVQGFCFSGLPGPAGNRESFVLIDNRPEGVASLEEAALRAEPRE